MARQICRLFSWRWPGCSSPCLPVRAFLAGGAALLAQHLTTRATEDLDFFTAPERGHVPAARDALEAAASQRGWTAQRIHDRRHVLPDSHPRY
jgi:Nucleotidyl transferase AbiEii toxin, Type IV TA system